MSKPAVVTVVLVIIAALGGLWFYKNRRVDPVPEVVVEPELPVNMIPIVERPFVTLLPDDSGRNVTLSVDRAPTDGDMEYEMVYNAADKQEGVFGRLNLVTEKQPIVKKLLLGSQSAGGKVTYHEGVTGGSLTLTYGSTKLKEQWNFLRFDPADPTFSAPDARFSVTFGKTALKKNQVVIVMKSFGLPFNLPSASSLKAGPYTFLTPSPIKGEVEFELKLPAGDYTDPQILAYDGKAWTALKTKVDGETLTATASSVNVIVAVTP